MLIIRMKTRTMLFLVLMFGPDLLFAAQDDNSATNDADLEAITERERQYTDGLLHRNFDELGSVFAETYVNTSFSGQLRTKAEFLKALEADTSRISEIRESEKQTQIYGDTAIVTVKFDVQGTDEGQSFEAHGRATDVWVKLHGEWFCVAAHSSPTQ
jgi:ketosteroid isomerase-like protein